MTKNVGTAMSKARTADSVGPSMVRLLKEQVSGSVDVSLASRDPGYGVATPPVPVGGVVPVWPLNGVPDGPRSAPVG